MEESERKAELLTFGFIRKINEKIPSDIYWICFTFYFDPKDEWNRDTTHKGFDIINKYKLKTIAANGYINAFCTQIISKPSIKIWKIKQFGAKKPALIGITPSCDASNKMNGSFPMDNN